MQSETMRREGMKGVVGSYIKVMNNRPSVSKESRQEGVIHLVNMNITYFSQSIPEEIQFEEREADNERY